MARWKLPEGKSVPDILILKWGRKDILDGGYVAIPKRFLSCMRQALGGKKPLSDLRVILAVVDYKRAGQKGEFISPPSLGVLSKISGLSMDVVHERLIDLKKRGLIRLRPNRDPRVFDVDIGGLTERVIQLTSDEEEEEPEETKELF